MIRSTCAALFAFALATVLVTSPQSTEAKDRRCRSYYRPQPVCCQPQPTCCQPKSMCCRPCLQPRLVAYEYCAQWQWATWSGYCSFYATNCTNSSDARSIDAPCYPTPGICRGQLGDPQNALCIDSPPPLMLSADQLATKAGGIKNGTRLSRKHRQKEGPVAAAQVDIGTSEDYKFIKVGTIVAQLRTYVAAKNGQGIAVSVGQEVEANPLPALSPYTNYQKLDTYAFSVEVGGKIYQVVTREAVPNQP